MNCDLKRQLTISLENRPGVLSRVAKTLAAHSVNIRGICVQDSVEQGVVRLLAEPWEEALQTLQEAGFHPVQADVVELETHSVPGALGMIAGALGAEGINIEYAYGTEPVGGASSMSIVVKVSQSERAVEVIKSFELPSE
ncbi:ACT domain-containing protein [Pelagicoccus albus]|uniref:ACT domain-containing protein n=1 Tax=Pelagicoccus albus TaxID=415222 RepID=A0A7X1E8T1_9BACT|nr:ACT domain-containing protein [Pelagicoccus albus]MBC2606679.1 ACT domain-containing protein [Pelagicoccus albus]